MNQPVSEAVDSFALFVGSLSANTNQEHLVKYFSKYGLIQGANLITDWATGASKRCAIVFCADEKTGRLVLEQKCHKLDGKIIRVSMADQEKKGTKKISTTNLFVGNISEKCSEQDIRLLFDKFGQIDSVRFFKNASTKQNTKNAIIQYYDSKSVELAFKSKSEMGSTDDSLKISPLKQKKAPSSKDDPLEEMTSMMMHLYNQGFEQQMPSMGFHMKGLQFGNCNNDVAMLEDDNEFPQAVRRHRKSSSVDILHTPKTLGVPYFDNENYPGLKQQQYPAFTMSKQSQISNLNSFKTHTTQFKMNPSSSIYKPEIGRTTNWSNASENEEKYQPQNNFVTLIDLFDDEDNLSTSFYGVSPMKRSRNLGSTTKSRRAIGDSSSECPEEDHSVKLSE